MDRAACSLEKNPALCPLLVGREGNLNRGGRRIDAADLRPAQGCEPGCQSCTAGDIEIFCHMLREIICVSPRCTSSGKERWISGMASSFSAWWPYP